MDCPKCKTRSTKVIEARRDLAGGKRRRRECQNCKWRFTTYEVYSHNLIDDDEFEKETKELTDLLEENKHSIMNVLDNLLSNIKEKTNVN